MRALIFVSAFLGFALVASAALGAHLVLADIRAGDPASPVLRQWDQAIAFGLFHVLAALACAVLPTAPRARFFGGWLFVIGVLLFSGAQLIRIAGAPLSAFVVPIGGLALMAGWLLLAASTLMAKPAAQT